MRKMFGISCFAALVAAIGMSGAASAATLQPTLVSVTQIGSNYLWTYSIQLTSGSQANPGAKVSIEDFSGYIPGSESWVGANFAASLDANLTKVDSPGNVNYPTGTILNSDSSLYVNLVVTYTGSSTLLGPVNPVGTLTALSTVGLPALTTVNTATFNSFFLSQDDPASDSNGVNTQITIGNAITPVGGGTNSTPLPASVWGGLSLMGAMGGLSVARRRRR